MKDVLYVQVSILFKASALSKFIVFPEGTVSFSPATNRFCWTTSYFTFDGKEKEVRQNINKMLDMVSEGKYTEDHFSDTELVFSTSTDFH